MRKLLFAFVALIAVNLVSAQDYDKSYVKYKQTLVGGKWAEREPSESYLKFNMDDRESIHIHDDNGIHIDAHEKVSVTSNDPVMVGDWEKYETTLIVDKDYNNVISVGTEVRMVLWRNIKSESAAYSIISVYGEVLYVVYKHEVVYEGVIEDIVYFKTY